MISLSLSEPSVYMEDRAGFLLLPPYIACVLYSLDPVSAELQTVSLLLIIHGDN